MSETITRFVNELGNSLFNNTYKFFKIMAAKNANIANDLEVVEGTEVVAGTFADLQHLLETNPEWETGYDEDVVSAKAKLEREPRVLNGLTDMATLMDGKLPHLLIALGKWWEIKPARNTIKKEIDRLAALEGLHPWEYYQREFLPYVQMLKSMGDAINRLSYAVNYSKPRPGAEVKAKVAYKVFTVEIDGKPTNVQCPKVVVEELQNKYPKWNEDKKQRDKFRKEIIEKSEPVENTYEIL